MLTVSVEDTATVRLQKLPEEARQRLRAVIFRNNPILAGSVRAKLDGPVLRRRSGRLVNSIKNEMREGTTYIYGIVYSRGVPYARIHEYGGQTRPHDIVPRNAKALHFWIGGKEVFSQRVHHPGSKIPMRSYMRSSLREMQARLSGEIAEAGRPRWP